MLPTLPPLKLRLMPLLLLVLLSACGHDSPLRKPPPTPLIPPLPQQARQTELPMHSANASANISQWLQAPTAPSLPASPASGLMTR